MYRRFLSRNLFTCAALITVAVFLFRLSPAAGIACLAVYVCLILLSGYLLFQFALNPRSRRSMTKHLHDAVHTTEENEKAYEWIMKHGQKRTLRSRDGITLSGLWIPNPGAGRIAFICHGYGDNRFESVARTALHFFDAGFHVFLPWARAHGESGGRYIGMGWPERRDCRNWLEELAAKEPESPILLFGVSMGGATVMMLSGEKLPEQVKGIIEDCGYSSVWEEFSLQLKNLFGLPAFPFLPAASLFCKIFCGFWLSEPSAVKQLKKNRLPILFIHGEADSFVPYAMMDTVYGACPVREKIKLSVPGAGHAMSCRIQPELYWHVIFRFLEKVKVI